MAICNLENNLVGSTENINLVSGSNMENSLRAAAGVAKTISSPKDIA